MIKLLLILLTAVAVAFVAYQLCDLRRDRRDLRIYSCMEEYRRRVRCSFDVTEEQIAVSCVGYREWLEDTL